jgi:hypothetical protein
MSLDSIQKILVTTRVADNGYCGRKHSEKCFFDGSTSRFLNVPEINMTLGVIYTRCKGSNERLGLEMKIDWALFCAGPKIIPDIVISVPLNYLVGNNEQ